MIVIAWSDIDILKLALMYRDHAREILNRNDSARDLIFRARRILSMNLDELVNEILRNLEAQIPCSKCKFSMIIIEDLVPGKCKCRLGLNPNLCRVYMPFY